MILCNFEQDKNMNITVKTIILDTLISAGITLVGGGDLNSFIFLFIVLFIPVISIFVSIDIAKKTFKKKSDKDSTTREKLDEV